jgi:hypothetical protein
MRTLILATLVAISFAVGDAELVSFTRDRIRAWQPVAEERSFDKIGWAKDIRDALRLAKENDRPVFLFTHTGRINTGRC